MNLRDANDGFYNGSSYKKDFMYISTSNRYVNVNKTAYFLKPADSTDWVNIPTGMPRNTDVYGIREVIYCDSNLILVKITEIYPVSGRQYLNAYRGSEHTWGTWYVITPQA